MKRLKISRETKSGYLFILPLVIILAVFLAYPILKAALMSVQYWKMTKPSPDGHYFVGVENYVNVFQDEFFWNSARVTVLYMVVTVAFRFILGFGTALTLNTKFRGCGLARALIIIPWAVPEVVACLVWILMYDKDYGIINSMLTGMGVLSGNVGWLLDKNVALPAAMAVNSWTVIPTPISPCYCGVPGKVLAGALSCIWLPLRELIRRCMRPPQSTGLPASKSCAISPGPHSSPSPWSCSFCSSSGR